MDDELTCPICTMTDILEAPEVHECATCGHEWAREPQAEEDGPAVQDANGTRSATEIPSP